MFRFDGEDNQGRASELVGGIHAGTDAASLRAGARSHESVVQSADAARFAHTGICRRLLSFCMVEDRSGHEASYIGLPDLGATGNNLLRIAAFPAHPHAGEVSGAFAGGRALPDYAGL